MTNITTRSGRTTPINSKTSSYQFIKNPMTIVGLFAGLVEICGAVVMPNIPPESKAMYVWFLMGFPIILVLLFFLTLNFNRIALYAPSDFENQDDFRDILFAKSGSEQIRARQREKLVELQSSEQLAHPATATIKTDESKTDNRISAFKGVQDRFRSERDRLILSETLVLQKLEEEYGGNFQRNMTYSGGGNSNLTFDGLIIEKGKSTIVEIKFITSHSRVIGIVRPLFDRIKLAMSAMSDSTRNSVDLLLLFVVDEGGTLSQVKEEIEKLIPEAGLDVRAKVLTYDQLIEQETKFPLFSNPAGN